MPLYHHKLNEVDFPNEYMSSGLEMPSGAVFYASFSSDSDTAETGQNLTTSGTFTYNNDNGIPCAISDGGYIWSDLSSETNSFNEVSYSLWYRKPTDSTGFYPCAFGTDGTDKRLALYYSSSYTGLAINYGGSSYTTETANMDFTKWNHLLLTYNYATHEAKGYLNGILFGTNTHTLDLSSANIYLFTRPDFQYSSPSNTMISSVRIYDKILTQSEITTLSQEFIPKVEYSSTGFDELGHPEVYDSAEDADCNIWHIPTGYIRYAPLNTSPLIDETGAILKSSGTITFNTDSEIQCVTCSGTGNYIYYSNGISGLSSYTLSAWMKRASSSVSALITFGGGSFGSGGNEIWVNYTSNGTISLSNGASSSEEIVKATGYTDPLWHNISYIWNGSSIILYVDGIEVGRNNSPNYHSSDSTLSLYINTLGRAPGDVGRIGKYSSLRLYNRALSLLEIRSLAKEFHPTI